MHRADSVNLLAANLPAGIVHTGHRAIGFDQTDDIACVKFANGVTTEADVVAGADGIHSALRLYVTLPSRPVFHGTVSYRGLVARALLPDWPMDRWQVGPGRSSLFAVCDAELAAHAEFRKRLYAFDAVPDARAAVAGLPWASFSTGMAKRSEQLAHIEKRQQAQRGEDGRS